MRRWIRRSAAVRIHGSTVGLLVRPHPQNAIGGGIDLARISDVAFIRRPVSTRSAARHVRFLQPCCTPKR